MVYGHDSSSVHESATFSQQLDIPNQRGHTRQYEEAQGRNQIQIRQVADRIRILEQKVTELQTQLNEKKKENDYHTRKAIEFYKTLCLYRPKMLAKHRQKAQATLLAANAPRPSAPISLAIAPSVLCLPAPPSSVVVTSVPCPSAPISSTRNPAISRQSARRLSAVPSVPRLSAPLPLAPVPSAPCQATVLSPTSSLHTPSSASSVITSALYIDLTLDETPLRSHTSQRRKRAPEQESQVGDQLRKKILTKSFEWMEPKDRPNFNKRNPLKPDPTCFERPLDVDPTRTDEPYPTDSLQYGHNLGQASQEPPLAPGQAPAHPLAPARLPHSQKNKLSKPRARKPNNKKPQATAKLQRLDEGRERIQTKEEQIMQEQNATTAGKTQEQEAEDFETRGAEKEAILGKGVEDINTMAAEMEGWLGQDESD